MANDEIHVTPIAAARSDHATSINEKLLDKMSSSTPITSVETPMTEDSLSADSSDRTCELLSPIHSIKNLSPYWTTNTPAAFSQETQVSTTSSTSAFEPCAREPSPQHEGRALFLDRSRDDFPVERVAVTALYSNDALHPIRREDFARITSAGPGIPASNGSYDVDNGNDRFPSPRGEVLSNSSRSHRLRSRRYQQQLEVEHGPLSSSVRNTSTDRRKPSRRRTSSVRSYYSDSQNSNSFSVPVVNINDDVSVSSSEASDELSSQSPRKVDRKYRTKTRRNQPSGSLISDSSSSGGNSGVDPILIRLFGKKFSAQHLATTRALVWLLCFVGLVSISTIVTTSHKITRSLDSNDLEQEHVTVLFQRSKSQRKKGRKARVMPSLRQSFSLNTAVDHTMHGTVNLHKLSQFQDSHEVAATTTERKTKDNNISHHEKFKAAKKEDDQHHHDHNHHHHSSHHKQISQDKKKDKRNDQSSNDVVENNELHLVKPITAISAGVGNPSAFIDPFLYSIGSSSLLSGEVYKRVVVVGDESVDDEVPAHRELELYPSPFTDNTQLYPLLDSADDEDERIKTMELRPPYKQGECVPMASWQTTYYPSCNGMHELDIANNDGDFSEQSLTLFGKNGFWRNAWRYDNMARTGKLETVVLKTLKINHRFEDKYYEHNRIDAIVLERLTGSPHVIDIFGFCGHSVLTEYADGKRLGDLADKKKKIPLARLKIAIDIASGLADVHGIDGDENASFVHLDINPANVVSIGGTLKLNDFNIGVLRKWNTTSNKPCGIPAQYPNPQWRSPEEARGENNLTEKVDVFSLGHIFFRLICGREPWNKLEPNGMPPKAALNEKVKNGELPTIPDEVMKSKDPEVIAIREAMFACYKYNPADRPSAREIVGHLANSLAKLQKHQINHKES